MRARRAEAELEQLTASLAAEKDTCTALLGERAALTRLQAELAERCSLLELKVLRPPTLLMMMTHQFKSQGGGGGGGGHRMQGGYNRRWLCCAPACRGRSGTCQPCAPRSPNFCTPTPIAVDCFQRLDYRGDSCLQTRMLEGAAEQEAQLPYSDLSSEDASEYGGGEDGAMHAGGLAGSAPASPAPAGRDGSGCAGVAPLAAECSAADVHPGAVAAPAAAADAPASPRDRENGTL